MKPSAPADIHEPARRTPVTCEVDLCVVGGSSTGAFAAVRATWRCSAAWTSQTCR